MDTANHCAKSRSRLGLSRKLQQERTNLPPNPACGGTRGYPVWFRQRILATAAMIGNDLAAEQWGVCIESICNWQDRETPYRMTGGLEKEALTGYDQLLLAIGLYIYPNASADGLCMFIVANGGDVYSREQISDRCSELNITRKDHLKKLMMLFLKVRWPYDSP